METPLLLSTKLEVVINCDSPVLVRDQLIEQIGFQIASGTLKSNEHLPSIRALAQRLGVHQSIVHAAYSQLAEIGMLEVRHGSGVRVMPNMELSFPAPSELAGAVARFLSSLIEHGYSPEQISTCIQQTLHRPSVKNIVVVDANVDFHPVILAELTPQFKLPVIAMTAEKLEKSAELLTNSLIITSLYHVNTVRSLAIDPTRFMICNVEPAHTPANLIKSLPDSTLVVFISVSTTLLKMAENLVASLRGESISVRSILASDLNEIRQTLPHAKAVICDLASKDITLQLPSKIQSCIYNLYSDHTIKAINERLKQWG